MNKIYILLGITFLACANRVNPEINSENNSPENVEKLDTAAHCLEPLNPEFKTGADQLTLVTHKLKGKRFAIIGNQSSQVEGTHLVDTLSSLGFMPSKIFCPEHGFRGEGAAGATIDNSIDPKSGLPIKSLYGKNKKPVADDLKDLDLLVFDIQDVGARFYTYISTLHYIMEAAAENKLPVLVLDRPNPNGYYVDGPILDPKFSSFIGMHEIPVVHGMTIGEYALMINGENWLLDGLKCDLEIITCTHYHHSTQYELPVKPSPNLPNALSVGVYPSLCFFEGTAVSVGRGTDLPFQIWGHPDLEGNDFKFTPSSRKEAPNPKLEGKNCVGYKYDHVMLENLRCTKKLDLAPLLHAYSTINDNTDFFTRPDFFDLLAGSDQLRTQISQGKTEQEIRQSWTSGLEKFKKIRQKYLLYPEN